MDIILLKNLDKVGRKFEIVKVKDGYGRNFLIPQGLAIVANKVNRNNLDSFKRQESAKLNRSWWKEKKIYKYYYMNCRNDMSSIFHEIIFW